MVRVAVLAAHTAPVALDLFRGWGSLRSTEDMDHHGDEALLCSVAGESDGGKLVIGLMDSVPMQSNTIGQTVEASMVFDCPSRISKRSVSAAAAFPYLALTAAAALHSVGLPPGRASIGMDRASGPATVVIAGSAGRLPAFLAEVLAARGAQPVVAVAEDAVPEFTGRFGVDCIVNHNRESFCSRVGAADAVIDCIGREEETYFLRDAMGAVYVSAASPKLLTLASDGAFQQLQRWRETFGSPGQVTSKPVWSADALAAEALCEALDLVDSGMVALPEDINGVKELAQQYIEYTLWPRDTETGKRFGFPGESLWPSDGGLAEDDAE